MYRYKKACFGGTFDRLHKGHRTLIDFAFSIAEMCLIGITTDHFIKKMKKYGDVASYSERKSALEKYLKTQGYEGRYEIVELNDFYSPELLKRDDIEAIVVGNEQPVIDNAVRINRMREENGLKKMDVVVVDLVSAYDSRRISSTRIRAREIDEEGEKISN